MPWPDTPRCVSRAAQFAVVEDGIEQFGDQIQATARETQAGTARQFVRAGWLSWAFCAVCCIVGLSYTSSATARVQRGTEAMLERNADMHRITQSANTEPSASSAEPLTAQATHLAAVAKGFTAGDPESRAADRLSVQAKQRQAA